jgi:subtilase-type serine protease
MPLEHGYHRYRVRLGLFGLVVPSMLVACGGGGGDGGTAAPGQTDSTVLSRFFVESFAAYETAAQALITGDARYLRQQIAWFFDFNQNGTQDLPAEETRNTYPLQSAGVHYAHAAGLTGAGQTIAIIDDGFLTTHEAFAGKTISVSGSPAILDHGTLVASVAAGQSATMIGVAPGADLVLGSFDSFAKLAAGTRLAAQHGAVALNNSWGFPNTPVGSASYNSVFSGVAAQDYLQALRSYAQTGVVVFAASNTASDSRADLMAALPVMEPGLEAGWIAVINGDAVMNGNDVVAAHRISAPCLEAAAWCLAAEGTWSGAIATAGGTTYGASTGTSFAAPMVAGALALLGQAFPDMTPHQLRLRLLASADNDFAGFNTTTMLELVPGFSRAISSEWGHGFLDVRAALLPIGPTTATLSDGVVYDIARPLVVEGVATGDAVARALSSVSFAVSDVFDAAFALPAHLLVAERSQTELSTLLYRDWSGGAAQKCCGLASYFPESRVIGMGSDALTLAVMVPAPDSPAAGFGVMLGQSFDSDIGQFSMGLSMGNDHGALLPRGYAGSQSTVLAGELTWSAPIGPGMELALAAGYGGTLAGGDANFNSASITLGAGGVFAPSDRLSLSAGLPVAVSRGSTSMTLPVMTRDGTARFQTLDVDLAPQEREMRLGVSYEYPITAALGLNIGFAHARNFGHVAGKSSTGALVGFRIQF